MTLRTFHVGMASKISDENQLRTKHEGVVEIDDLRTVDRTNANGEKEVIVVSRSSEFKVMDPKTGVAHSTTVLPYGSVLFVKEGQKVKKDTAVCEWDPYNNVIISEEEGTIGFESIEEGLTYREELDEQTGFREIVITESRDKKKTLRCSCSARRKRCFVPRRLWAPTSVKRVTRWPRASSCARFLVSLESR